VQVGQRRVQLGLGSARDSVRRPGVDEVRRGGEVPARVDVPVLGGDDEVVPVAVPGGVRGDGRGGGVATRDGQGAALAERGLHVNHDERAVGPGHATQ